MPSQVWVQESMRDRDCLAWGHADLGWIHVPPLADYKTLVKSVATSSLQNGELSSSHLPHSVVSGSNELLQISLSARGMQ